MEILFIYISLYILTFHLYEHYLMKFYKWDYKKITKLFLLNIIIILPLILILYGKATKRLWKIRK